MGGGQQDFSVSPVPLGLIGSLNLLSTQTLSPKPFSPKPKIKGPWADTKLLQTTTTHRLTFKHEGGVQQQNTMSKNILRMVPSTLQVSHEDKGMVDQSHTNP